MQALPRRGMLAAIIAVAVIVLDQITKVIVRDGLAIGQQAEFIPWFINFTHIENEGAAWGMFSEHRWVFMILSSVAIVAMIVFLCKYYKRSRLMNIGIAMVLGGGIGNMIDRIAFGKVTDFLCFTFIDFPVFNVADSFVCIGAAVIAVYVIFFELKNGGTDDKSVADTAERDGGDGSDT